MCDAAVVGGVDTLCRLTLRGFDSLALIAPGPCRPCDAARDGVSIGEAAGFALVERERAGDGADGLAILGFGATSDGYHMSSPDPRGIGAIGAMTAALARAGLAPDDIDYVNLHGTGTPVNDAMEDVAVHEVFGARTPCSSTKGWSGHALGAAGILEAIVAALSIRLGLMPGCLGVGALDPAFRSMTLTQNVAGPRQAGDEQFLRLRRGELQPRPRGGGVIEAYLAGVSIWGPGLEGWEGSRPILTGRTPYLAADTPPPAPALLPPNERRRTGIVVRLALEAALRAAEMSGLPPSDLGIVFGSSNGDAPVVNDILEAITQDGRPVSPTQFHNSVHNAGGGLLVDRNGIAQGGDLSRLPRRHRRGLAAQGRHRDPDRRRAGAAVRLRRSDPGTARGQAPDDLVLRGGLRVDARRRRASARQTRGRLRGGEARRGGLAAADRGLEAARSRQRGRPVPAPSRSGRERMRRCLRARLSGRVPQCPGDAVLSREAIASLIPHKGASVLLDRVVAWSAGEIVAETRSHLEAGNPLRREGRLEMVCGIEYGLQAAALHGALLNGGDGAAGGVPRLLAQRRAACALPRPNPATEPCA